MEFEVIGNTNETTKSFDIYLYHEDSINGNDVKIRIGLDGRTYLVTWDEIGNKTESEINLYYFLKIKEDFLLDVS